MALKTNVTITHKDTKRKGKHNGKQNERHTYWQTERTSHKMAHTANIIRNGTQNQWHTRWHTKRNSTHNSTIELKEEDWRLLMEIPGFCDCHDQPRRYSHLHQLQLLLGTKALHQIYHAFQIDTEISHFCQTPKKKINFYDIYREWFKILFFLAGTYAVWNLQLVYQFPFIFDNFVSLNSVTREGMITPITYLANTLNTTQLKQTIVVRNLTCSVGGWK